MQITFGKKIVSEKGAGRVATEPRVRVAENGQVGLNSLALAAFASLMAKEGDGYAPVYAIWGTDAPSAGDKRKETVCQLKAIPVKADTKFPLKLKGMDVTFESIGQLAKIGFSKDGKSCFTAMAGDLRAVGYDYKASGSQSFAAEIDEKAKTVTFTLPVGALTPAPKQARAKKEKGTSASAPAEKAAASAASQELELELS